MNLWKRKLAAYLHDPPEKAYDFSPRHRERARAHAASFGVAELWDTLTHNPDWSAAAADRFIFPDGKKVGNLSVEGHVAFLHPISGSGPDGISLPAPQLKFPEQDDAEQWLGDIRPDWKSDDPQTLFLRAWRNWSAHAAGHASGAGKGAELLPYLPADTRIPDASIWHHCAIVSALEATRAGDDPKSPLRPAFLLFQVGPVQEFIAQARSTRDLWSGSYLLSWLTMHAIKAVADACGPDAIIFPSLKGQPLYDFLERRLDLRPHDNDVLVPGIPNRFLALVPANLNVEQIVAATFRNEWQAIADVCKQWLHARGIPFAGPYEALWNQQVATHWHITWQLWPWQEVKHALDAFAKIPLGKDNPLHLAKSIAHAIPDDHKDDRCYRGGQLDPGWAWSAHYQLCQHALDARRATRDFAAIPAPVDADGQPRPPGHRDALSGREEAVVQADKIEQAAGASAELRHLFRHIEPLGAANLIKRVWHKAYLARLDEVPGKGHLPKLQRARESFDSVPSVAAGGWLRRLEQRLAENQDLWLGLIDVSEKLAAARPHISGISIPDAIGKNSRTNESRWLDHVEAEVFTQRLWNNLDPETRSRPEVKAAADAIRDFKKDHKLGEPPSYYAVLALDGDQIGRWLSGEKSPPVESVLSPKAAKYFRENITGLDVEKWLKSPRPLSPSWHLQFSEALANFGLYAARRIVEDIHHGQLIYSGGDDVLAMLPADEAIFCARDLRAAFQGRLSDMSSECSALFRNEAPEGFLWLANPKRDEPTWPLLVPGPRMTVSVGLAIGHVKEPLQDMIAEAQAAEKRAKAPAEREVWDEKQKAKVWKPNHGWDRDALAVTLFKRSGETIQWGAKFGSPAFPLLELFQRHYRPPVDNPDQHTPISGKFPYRVAELLGNYSTTAPLCQELRDIALAEFTWITQQQIRPIGPDPSEALRALATAYLDHLLQFTWERPAANGGKQPTQAPRPLREFIHLFALEAFIARTGE